jgi:NADPH-dependent F420 reductase
MTEGTYRIAVLGGTGAEGRGIALRLARAGHRVTIGSRDPERAAAAAAELGKRLGISGIAGHDNGNAAASAEIVVLSVPFAAERETLEGVRAVLDGKILVDVTAPLVPPRVGRVQLPPGGSTVAATQAWLGEAVRVVSAFQNISAEKLEDPGTAIDCDVLVCADDAAARRTVIGLVADMGMRGIDAGPVCNSAAAEALTSVLITINRRYRVSGAGIRIVGLPDG